MKKLFHNDTSLKHQSVIGSREEHQVVVTHLLDALTPEELKCKVLDLLTDEKGRLEFKDGNVILSFWKLKDKEEFLVKLK